MEIGTNLCTLEEPKLDLNSFNFIKKVSFWGSGLMSTIPCLFLLVNMSIPIILRETSKVISKN